MDFYIKKKTLVIGPFTEELVNDGLRNNKIQKYDAISESRSGPWIPVSEWILTHGEDPQEPESLKSNGLNLEKHKKTLPIENEDIPLKVVENDSEGYGANTDSQVKWYYRIDDSEPGPPVSEKTIRSMIKKGDLDKSFYVWNENMEEWRPIGEFFGVEFAIKNNREKAKLPVQEVRNEKFDRLPGKNIKKLNNAIYELNKKSKFVAYLLYFFLGYFGAHAFYLGKYAKGASLIFQNLFYIILFNQNIENARRGVRGGNEVFIGILFISLACWYIYDLFTLWYQVDCYNNNLIDKVKGRAI
jgi:hypothetical protein